MIREMRADTVDSASRIDSPSGRLSLIFSAFVWGVWAAAFLATVIYVGQYGSNVPFWDDWEVIPALTGEQPITWRWLWEPYHEHRIVLPKVIFVALGKLTGCDFRAGMYFNALVLGGLSCAMIMAARRMRGWTSPTDAFFPLVLLHWGNWMNLLLFFTVHFISTTVVAGILLSIIARGRDLSSPGTALVAGGCLLLLPLTGSAGLAFVPPLACWFGYSGMRQWRSQQPHARRDALLIFGMTLASIILVILSIIGLDSQMTIDYADLLASLRTAAQFLSVGLGMVTRPCWPFSALVMFGLMLLGTTVTVAFGLRQPSERSRALGLFSFLAAMAILALGVGLGRGVITAERGFSPHYVTLAALTLCCIYFMLGLCRRPHRQLAQLGLFCLMVLVFPLNMCEGLREGSARREKMARFERDLAAKTSPYLLADRHIPFLLPYYSKDFFADRLLMFRHAGIRPYRCMPDDPAARAVPLLVVSGDASRGDRSDGPRHGSRDDSPLTFILPKPRFVYSTILKFSSGAELAATPPVRIYWRRSDRKDGPVSMGNVHIFNSLHMGGGEAHVPLKGGPGETILEIKIYDKLDVLEIAFDDSRRINVSEVVLLVPMTADRGGL